MLEAIKNRRSIRTYTDKEVEEEKIIEILKSAMQAPSSKNSSPWEFIVVDDKEILTNIEKFSSHYKNDAIDFERWFTVIYLGMIAEENKKNAILGKKIKGLAMYQIMMGNFSAKEAANYSKGKKASELLEECNAIGIY